MDRAADLAVGVALWVLWALMWLAFGPNWIYCKLRDKTPLIDRDFY